MQPSRHGATSCLVLPLAYFGRQFVGGSRHLTLIQIKATGRQRSARRAFNEANAAKPAFPDRGAWWPLRIGKIGPRQVKQGHHHNWLQRRQAG